MVDTFRIQLSHFFANIFTWSNILWVFDKFSIVTLAVAVVGFWFEQRRRQIRQKQEERARMRRACDAILTEIEGSKAMFTDKSGYVTNVKRNEDIDYLSATFASEAYQSLLHSGFYPYFKPKTQMILSSLYTRIKNHNELAIYINHYFDLFTLYDNSDTRTQGSSQ